MDFPFRMQHPTAHNLRFLRLYCLECRLQRLGNVVTDVIDVIEVEMIWFSHNLLDMSRMAVCWMLNEGVLCF